MDVINQLILLPSVEHQGILPYLIAFMLLLHLPFLGMTLIASLLSLLTGRRDPGTADAFRRLIPLTAGTMIVFVVLPLLSLVFLYRQYLFQQPIPIGLYLLRMLPVLATARSDGGRGCEEWIAPAPADPRSCLAGTGPAGSTRTG